MATFKEADRVRVSLKVKLSQFAWYCSSHLTSVKDGYSIVVNVKRIDNAVRKQVPPLIDGVSIKVEVE